MRIYLALVLATTLALSPLHAQRLTLREEAAQAHDEVNGGIGFDGVSPTIAEMVAEAKLIVYGRVLAPQSYLSPDGMMIFSDYPIQIRRVLAGSLPLAKRPGSQSQIVMTYLGGELQLEGQRVRYSWMGVSKFSVGSDVILLLNPTDEGKYVTVHEAFGVFVIENGLIRTLVKRVGKHRELDGRPVGAFEDAIEAAKLRKGARR